MRDEEGKGQEEEKEKDSSGLKGGEAMDRGVALEEWIRIRGDKGLVDEGEEEAEDEEVKLQVFKEAMGGRERVVGLGRVVCRGSAYQVVYGGADKVVEPQ